MGAAGGKPHEAFEVTPAGMPYASPRALAAAITDRIAVAVEAGSPYTHTQLRRQLTFDRLLARVFVHDPDHWILKGGGSLLARIPARARHSIDIDLAYRGEVDAAVEAVRAATDHDLGDYFTFDLTSPTLLTGGSIGARLKVTVRLGGKLFDRFGIDVVVETTLTGPPDLVPPIRPVDIPGLWSPAYRTYPVANQLADKHLAMVGIYSGKPSSRHRDLADIVLLATSQRVSAASLHEAVHTGYAARQITPPAEVALPGPDWETQYPKIAQTVPALEQQTTTQALAVAKALLEPILAGRTTGTWDPNRLAWIDEED